MEKKPISIFEKHSFVGLEGKSVLLVDDDPSARLIIRFYLAKFGMSITESDNGSEALCELQNRTPDLVITDLHMPICDGKDLLKGMRQIGLNLPVIVLSGCGQEADRKEFTEAGFADCLQKGSTPDKIFKSIQQSLNVK